MNLGVSKIKIEKKEQGDNVKEERVNQKRWKLEIIEWKEMKKEEEEEEERKERSKRETWKEDTKLATGRGSDKG